MDAETTKQIHGDFGNPFAFGGAWSDGQETVYTDGLEGEGHGHSDASGDDDPNSTVTVYRWNDAWTPADDDDWKGAHLDDACKCVGMGRAEFDSLPSAGKWLVLVSYMGAHELDSYPERYTRAELGRLVHDPNL